MITTLLNNHTKFRAKSFKPYRVTTFLVLGHFLATACTVLLDSQPHEVECQSFSLAVYLLDGGEGWGCCCDYYPDYCQTLCSSEVT